MLKLTRRLVAAAVLTGLVLSAFVVDAGLRNRRNCAMPSCAAPSCAGCFGPVGCQGPYMAGGMWGCSAPSYVVAPPMVSACSGPMGGCFAPGCYGPSCSQSGFGYGQGFGFGQNYGYGQGFGFNQGFGYSGMSMTGNPFYGSPYAGGSPYGVPSQYGVPASYSPVSNFGGVGYGGMGYGGASGLPPYYAPMPAQYAPIPPVPAADLVW